jgi:hypothetical protein
MACKTSLTGSGIAEDEVLIMEALAASVIGINANLL